jgi:hypothetical protein
MSNTPRRQTDERASRNRGDVDHRAFGGLELVEQAARQHDRREKIHLKDVVPIVVRGCDRVEPLAAVGFRRDCRIVDQRMQFAVQPLLDLGNRQVGVGDIGEIDLNVILGSGFPRAVFREGVARAGDHAPSGGGETLDGGVADAAAGSGEKKRAARTVAQWHFNSSIPTQRSWIKPRLAPARARMLAPEPDAVVQAKRPLVPELDLLRHHAIAGPMRRPRHGADAEFRGVNCHGLFECEPAFERGGLFARQAPICAMRGRDAKYASASAAETGSTSPRTRTWRCSDFQ